MNRKQILVEVLFYKDRESSRKTFPHLSNRIYCPHFVVKGTEFDIVEGGNIIGEGKVLEFI